MEEETQGGYIKFGELSKEQKKEALSLRPTWSDDILFWVDEEGHVFKCSMAAKKRKKSSEDKNSIHSL